MRDPSGTRYMKILNQKTFESGKSGPGRLRSKIGLGIRELLACLFVCLFVCLIIGEIFVEHTPKL